MYFLNIEIDFWKHASILKRYHTDALLLDIEMFHGLVIGPNALITHRDNIESRNLGYLKVVSNSADDSGVRLRFRRGDGYVRPRRRQRHLEPFQSV